MENNKIQFTKKRELGVLLNDSFAFLKQEKEPILKLILFYVVPFIIVYAIGQVYLQKNVLSGIDFSEPKALESNIVPFYKNLLMMVLFGIFIQSLLAGTYYSYIEAYTNQKDRNFQLNDISSNFFNNSLLALGSYLTFFFIVFFGMTFFIIPGLLLANTLSLVAIIAIHEKKGIGNALSRSWKLVNRQWWNTLFINLLGLLIIWGSSIILSIPAMMAGISSNLLSANSSETITTYPQWYWALTGLSVVISNVLLIIPFTFQAFQYFNLNERYKQL